MSSHSTIPSTSSPLKPNQAVSLPPRKPNDNNNKPVVWSLESSSSGAEVPLG